MTPANLFSDADTNPAISYIASRPEQKPPDYFCKLEGCHSGLKSWATGSGPTAEKALADAIHNWQNAGRKKP